MWPGDQQPGGQQQPQDGPPQQPQPQQPQQGGYGQPPNPYAQPQPGYPQQPGYAQPGQQPGQGGGYGQPSPYGPPANPYAQPGYPQQPGYPGQPAGGYQAPPPSWGAPGQGGPGGPGGLPPEKSHRKRTTVIAIASAVAVIAAVTVGAVYFTSDRHKKDDAKEPTTPAVAPTTAPTVTEPPTTSDDDPRGDGKDLQVKPVVAGWKVVRRAERNVAFDVPPDWSLDSETMTESFVDKKGNPQVAFSAPAFYKEGWCKPADGGTAARAGTGTKGGGGATSLQSAADTEAQAWAYWAYAYGNKGTVSKPKNSKAFTDAYGITGWQSEATVSNLKAGKCVPPGGTVYTVAWTDPAQAKPTLVVWVLYADTGVKDQLSQSIIDKIKSSIRPLKMSKSG